MKRFYVIGLQSPTSKWDDYVDKQFNSFAEAEAFVHKQDDPENYVIAAVIATVKRTTITECIYVDTNGNYREG